MIFEWTEREKTHFVELKHGDVFYVEDDRSTVFMRVKDIYNAETNEVDYNAVDFSDAALLYFFPEEKVNKVKAKMVLS